MRRARRTISSRSASVSCRNRVPRSTWSRCVVDEPCQARLEEPDLGPPVDDEPAGHQPLPPPAGDRPGRDVEPPAHRVDRQDRLGRLLDRLADGRRQVLDEQPEVVPDVPAVQHQGGRPLGPVAGDPEAEILVRVAPPGSISARSSRPGRSARAAAPRGEPRLLLLQLLHRRMAVGVVTHPRAPFPIRPVSFRSAGSCSYPRHVILRIPTRPPRHEVPDRNLRSPLSSAARPVQGQAPQTPLLLAQG